MNSPKDQLISKYIFNKNELKDYVEHCSSNNIECSLEELNRIEKGLEVALTDMVTTDLGSPMDSLEKLEVLLSEVMTNANVMEYQKTAIESLVSELKANMVQDGAKVVKNRRTELRKPIGKFGRIELEDQESRTFVTKNISQSGACIIVDDIEALTDRFLVSGIDDAGPIEAQEVWRKDNEIGIRFLEPSAVY